MAISQNTVIILKYSDTTAVPPSLNIGEPAYSNVSNKLWIGDKDGSVVAIGGKHYTQDIESATWQGIGNQLVRRDELGQIEATKYYQQGFDVLEHANAAFTLANTVSGEGISTVFAQANAAFDTANSSYIQANSAYEKANTAAGSNGAIQFNLLGGYGAHNEFYYNSGQKTVYANTFYATSNVDAQNVIAFNRFYAGIATSQATPVPYLLAQFTGNSAPYAQVNLQNIDGAGSADFVVTGDVGDDSTFFITTGMQGSQLEQGVLYPLDGYVIVQGNTSQLGGNLVIGAVSGTPGIKTKIVSHGYETDNVVAEFDETSVIFHPEVISPTTTRISLQANAAYNSQNTTGSYANSAFSKANSSYVSQNTTGEYANTAYLHANAAYESQNTTGVYANVGFIHANSAYESQNTTGVYANVAFEHANAAYVSQNTTGVYANSAYESQNTTGVYANTAYLHANSSYVSQNTTGEYANSSYLHANASYVSQNTTGVYANTAYLHANAAYTSQNSTGQYANSAYMKANSAYESQNTTGVYANTAYLHANASYISQNTTGEYANSAYLHANSAFDDSNTKVLRSGDAMTGDLSTSKNLIAQVVFANTELYVGISTYAATLLPNTVAQFTSNSNNYTQVNSQNIDQDGSADYVVTADVGSDTKFYIDMGLLNSQYNNQNPNNSLGTAASPLDGYLYVQGNTGQVGGNLIIGTTTPNQLVKIIAGGVDSENVIVQVDSSGVNINGNLFVEKGLVSPLTNAIYEHANSAYVSQNTTGVYANVAYLHANSAYVSQNTTGEYANSSYLHANASYLSQNTTGVYANSAYAFANTANAYFYGVSNTLNVAVTSTGNYANSAYLHANSAYVSQNTTGEYANSSYLHANAAYNSQNTTGGYANASYRHANSGYLHANSAYISQNITSEYANSSYLHANASYVSQNTTGVYANAAYALANTKFATSGGTITGDVVINANLTVSGEVTYVNTQTVLVGDNILTLNADIPSGQQPTENAGIEVARGVQPNASLIWIESVGKWSANNGNTSYYLGTDASESYANSAYLHANASYVSQNTTGVYANVAYLHANAAYQSQNSTGNYANSAHLHANASYVSQNTTGLYANSAYLHANAAYNSQNTTGEYANAAYAFANTANAYFYGVSNTINVAITTTGNYANASYLHANSAYVSQNTTGEYANSAYSFANTANAYFYGVSNTINVAITTTGNYANASYVSQNTTGVYANTAYLHANSAYVSQNTTGGYANSSYLHANAAYVSQNTTGSYANSAYLHANAAYVKANTAAGADGQLQINYSGGFGASANLNFSNTTNTLTTNNITAIANVGYANTTGMLKVYQFYNPATNSLDTVFV